jgi:hypothetical protein
VSDLAWEDVIPPDYYGIPGMQTHGLLDMSKLSAAPDPYGFIYLGYVDHFSAFILSFLQCYPICLGEDGLPTPRDQELIADLAMFAFPDASKILPTILPTISKYFTNEGFDPSWMYSINIADYTALKAITAGARLLHWLLHTEFNDEDLLKSLVQYKFKKPLNIFNAYEGLSEEFSLENVKKTTKEIFDKFDQINPFKAVPF